jgi:riboflavin biosynthesis pyrimidine reductase
MIRHVPASDLVVGMSVVERDGYTLTVTRIESAPRSRVVVVCSSVMGREITATVARSASIRVEG